MCKKNALVTGWSSGLWEVFSDLFRRQNIFTITTGRSVVVNVLGGGIHVVFDQTYDDFSSSILKEELIKWRYVLDYLVLNAWIICFDEDCDIEKKKMHIVNHTSTLDLLSSLYYEDFLSPHCRILVNASIQAIKPRMWCLSYALSKRNLADDVLKFAKQCNLRLCVIWPSMIDVQTNMFDSFMEYMAAKSNDNVDYIHNKLSHTMTPKDTLVRGFEELIYCSDDYFNDKYLHKFIAIEREWMTTMHDLS